jgi:hypothetical protein
MRALVTFVAVAAMALGTQAVAHGQRGGGRGNPLGITIYAEANFRGINQSFRTDVSDLRKYNMNDRVDSLQIPRGEFWEVCEDINYRGRCRVFNGDEPDLNRISWAGLISSLRKVKDMGNRRPETGPPIMRSRLILFDQIAFKGLSLSLGEPTPRLRPPFSNVARSAKVYGGAWELCDGPNFTGRCQTITDNAFDLARFGLLDKVSSVRPVPRR